MSDDLNTPVEGNPNMHRSWTTAVVALASIAGITTSSGAGAAVTDVDRANEARATLIGFAAARPGTPEGADKLLQVIVSVPDETYRQGPQATTAFLDRHYRDPRAYSTLASCAGGIIGAIGSNAVILAKLLKVKKAAQAIGGISRAISKIRGKVKAGKKFNDAVYEVFNEGGAGLGALAVEVFSIDLIANNCF